MVVVLSILVVVFSMFMSMRLKGILTDIGLGPLGGVVNGVMIQVFNVSRQCCPSVPCLFTIMGVVSKQRCSKKNDVS
eukprot:COSAG04_NODE_3662_length_2626_cov_6.475663_4_plen_77_part_00